MVYTHPIRVRYCDVDKMNIVYHSRHLDYWEWARTELFRNIGYTYQEIEENGYLLPSKSIEIQYHQPARYDEEIKIDCKLNSISRIKVLFEYETLSLKGDLLVSGHSIHVFTDHKLNVRRLDKSLFLRIKKNFPENHQPDK